eukprot:3713042-Prymnesium_polylepis.1
MRAPQARAAAAAVDPRLCAECWSTVGASQKRLLAPRHRAASGVIGRQEARPAASGATERLGPLL